MQFESLDRASELQRRIENRRNEIHIPNSIAFKQQVSSMKSLDLPNSNSSISLASPRPAVNKLNSVQMNLMSAENQNKKTLSLCDKHFRIEKGVRDLKTDLKLVQQRVHAKQQSLDSLSQRITMLTNTLFDTSKDKYHAAKRIKMQEDCFKEYTKPQECEHCKVHFLPHLLQSHQAICSTKQRLPLVYKVTNNSHEDVELHNKIFLQSSTNQSEITLVSPILPIIMPPTFLPQPPRNVRVVKSSITSTSFCITWDLPLFTGSVPILDYELYYSQYPHTADLSSPYRDESSIHRNCEKLSTSDSTVPLCCKTQRLSVWCLQNPVPKTSFLITDLLASCKYGDVQLVAITKNGKSATSLRVDQNIVTAPATPPSRPLFFETTNITSNSITIKWHPPFYIGGSPIISYELVFQEAIIATIVSSDTSYVDMSKISYKNRQIDIEANCLQYTISNLMSNAKHTKFMIRARNAAGYFSEYSNVLSCIQTTGQTGLKIELDELAAAVKSDSPFVDSSFLNGFMQRYDREKYIQLLEEWIISNHPDKLEMVRKILSENHETSQKPSPYTSTPDPNSQPQVAHTKPTISSNVAHKIEYTSLKENIDRRRQQFQFRINQLTFAVEQASYNIQWCKSQRMHLISLIDQAQSRIYAKQKELEIAKSFTGPQMDSDVLGNGKQRFRTIALINVLLDEVEIEKAYILDAKEEIVKVENYLDADLKCFDELCAKLNERKVAMEQFEQNPNAQSPQDLGNIDNNELMKSTVLMAKLCRTHLYKSFVALVNNRNESKARKIKLMKTAQWSLLARLQSAFSQWILYTNSTSRGNPDGNGGCTSRATISLKNAKLGRMEILEEVRGILSEVRNTDHVLHELQEKNANRQTSQSSSYTMLSKELWRPYICEAEARAHVNDHQGALKLYTSVIENPNWTTSMTTQDEFDVMIKLGKTLVSLKNYEQAIQVFHRAMVKVKNVDPFCEAKAQYYIGEIYLHNFKQIKLAISMLEKSLITFETINMENKHKYMEKLCCCALQQAYICLGDLDRAKEFEQQANEGDSTLAQMLNQTEIAYDKLKQRLIGVCAETARVIVLERVGAIVPILRKDRIKAKFFIIEEERYVLQLQSLLQEKSSILEQGKRDLMRALNSDTNKVESSIFTNCATYYEVENFKEKLAKYMGVLHIGKDKLQADIANAKVRIRNNEDNIKEIEEELAVETGPLMQRVNSKDHFRCFQFNRLNESLENVLGMTTHGIPTCVSVNGIKTLLFDTLTGTCLAQSLGDPLENKKTYTQPPKGPRKEITCIFYIGSIIYVGDINACMSIYNVKSIVGGYTIELEDYLTVFDASIVCIAADTTWIVVACSDCDIIVLDVATHKILSRIIEAHGNSVTCLEVDSLNLTFTSASADGKIKVWSVSPTEIHSKFTNKKLSSYRRKVQCTIILEAERQVNSDTNGEKVYELINGHAHGITSMRQIGNEIVSGDCNGRLVIWNIATNCKVLRICDHSHECNISVTCLQFDATRIVSAGADGNISVTDFASGFLLQTLRGHATRILDLQFDVKRLLSMSNDGQIRLWYWEVPPSRNSLQSGHGEIMFHVYSARDSLRSLVMKYHVRPQDLMKWNHLSSSKDLYLGQRLIVGNTTQHDKAIDELKTFDLEVSPIVGKKSFENLDYVKSLQHLSEHVEIQMYTQKLNLMAKEYFPSVEEDMVDEKMPTKQKDTTESSNYTSSAEDQDENTEDSNIESDSTSDTT